MTDAKTIYGGCLRRLEDFLQSGFIVIALRNEKNTWQKSRMDSDVRVSDVTRVFG